MLTCRAQIFGLAVTFVMAGVAFADDQTPKQRLTLMGMLQEWIYPESEFRGAQTSDAAVSDIGAIKSKAMLTTPDPVEKVMAFYCKKLKVDREGTNLGAKEGERITTERAVLIQNVSGDPASNLYLIAVNSLKSSTTLAISRADDSEVTRIAWANYRQVWP